ncbi:MAG: hypothetical protein OXI03_06670 [Chloroflexota bacterium]|nr:hypothetical protein [Chloroflexota bacterium]
MNGDQIAFARSLEEAATAALGFPAGTGAVLVSDDGRPAEARDAPAGTEAEAEPDAQAEAADAPPRVTDGTGEPLELDDLQRLLDELDTLLENSREQLDTLQRVRDALEVLLADETE